MNGKYWYCCRCCWLNSRVGNWKLGSKGCLGELGKMLNSCVFLCLCFLSNFPAVMSSLLLLFLVPPRPLKHSQTHLLQPLSPRSLQPLHSPLEDSCCMRSVPLKAELYAAWHLSIITDSTCVSCLPNSRITESPSLRGPPPASACCRNSLRTVPGRWSSSLHPNVP